MMIFTVHIVGYGPPDSDKPGARSDWQHPAPGNRQLLDIPQQDPGLTAQQARLLVKFQEAVKSSGCPERATGI
jgi:hypothetical protein